MKSVYKPLFDRHKLVVAVATTSLILSGCALEGDDGQKGEPGNQGRAGTPAFAPATLFVASNSSTDKAVRVRNETFGLLNTYETGGNEGIVVSSAGAIIQADDSGTNGRIITACNAFDRTTSGPSYAISGTNTGLVNPKGVETIPNLGLTLVANNGQSNILIFGSAASGDVAPFATLGLTNDAWDLTYDGKTDTLFVALVDGSVAVFDRFAENEGQGGITRLFWIEDADGEVSVNLHGIDYDAVTDSLVVSDVGQASSADDGKLYVLQNASSIASGTVKAATTWKGSETRLGNPVDLQITGTDVRIAEKANAGGAVLVYRNIFEAAGGNVAPDVIYDTPAPESIAVVSEQLSPVGATDVVNSQLSYQLLATSNPAPGSRTSGAIFSVDRNVAQLETVFDTTQDSIENITLDRQGTAYVNFNNTVNGPGIAVFGAIVERDEADPQLDRIIQGDNTQLISPKGIELADDLGLLIVSDTGTQSILAFSACAAGNATPIEIDTGGIAPWDSDYAPSVDTLFVALTNGTIAAYDKFSQTLGAGGPSRTIEPANTVNFHGIRYDQISDTLIVTDVGSAQDNSDGAILTIPQASNVSGPAAVGKRVTSPSPTGLLGSSPDESILGNPVDIAFDGKDLFVAEKANDSIQVYRDFLTDPSVNGVTAPTDTIAATKPESLILSIKR
ncbi:hypothetical protein KZZ05_18510 [Marinobacter adhaerens]|nr:hypothetical protein [Marinobacter adhaerens]MBW4980278.1 hypothetical protein [Marinobacter adhaerens]